MSWNTVSHGLSPGACGLHQYNHFVDQASLSAALAAVETTQRIKVFVHKNQEKICARDVCRGCVLGTYASEKIAPLHPARLSERGRFELLYLHIVAMHLCTTLLPRTSLVETQPSGKQRKKVVYLYVQVLSVCLCLCWPHRSENNALNSVFC